MKREMHGLLYHEIKDFFMNIPRTSFTEGCLPLPFNTTASDSSFIMRQSLFSISSLLLKVNLDRRRRAVREANSEIEADAHLLTPA